MTNEEKVKKALTTTGKVVSLENMIEKSTKELQEVLPKHMRGERLKRIALTTIRQTPELAKCNPASFVGALLVSAQLGLEPIAGKAYILPFWNSKTNQKEAQFLVGYRGLADLFYRHNRSVTLMWGTVRDGDIFDYEYGTNAYLRHRPVMESDGEVLGYYVIAELRGGAKPFQYMSKKECMAHGRQHSKTYDKRTAEFSPYSPWATDSDAMCKKTCLIQLSKLLPLSVELQRAIGADETSREYREGIDDVLDIPSTTDWNGEEAEIKEPEKVDKPKKSKQEFTYKVAPGNASNLFNVQKIDENGEIVMTYTVNTETDFCTCPSYENCQHQKLVAEFIKNHNGDKGASKAQGGVRPPEQAVKPAVKPESGVNEPPSKGKTPPWAKDKDKPASKEKIKTLYGVISKKVISFTKEEVEDCLPTDLTNSAASLLWAYLLDKEEVDPSDFMEKVAEFYEDMRRNK